MKRAPSPCTTEGCGRVAFSKGLCVRCYQAERRKGASTPIRQCDAVDATGSRCALDLHHKGPHRKRRAGCACPNAALGVHRVGCPTVPEERALPLEDHPLLVALLDELEPEMRSTEGVLGAAKRLKEEARLWREERALLNVRSNGRDFDER